MTAHTRYLAALVCLDIMKNIMGAEPLVPTCSQDNAICKIYLVAETRKTMTYLDKSLPDHWVLTPVEAGEGGLYIADGPDCPVEPRNLTDEESSSVIVGDGIPKLVYTFNGTVPGPPIVVYEGQEVHVTILNDLAMASILVHWHGINQRGTPYMDGAGGVSQCQISPGERFKYRFLAQPSGTHWYHSHSGASFAIGLQGAFIVLPQNPAEAIHDRGDDPLPEIQSEFVLTVSDWTKEEVEEIDLYTRYKGDAYARWYESGFCIRSRSSGGDTSKTNVWPFTTAVINGRGHHYNHWTGEDETPHVALDTFTVHKGAIYYFRVICSSLQLAFSISIDGHPLYLVATDGRPIVSIEVESLIIHSGERYDFWINATDPHGLGSYWIRAETLDRVDHYGSPVPYHTEAILHYDGYPTSDPTSLRENCTEDNKCITANCPYKTDMNRPSIICITADEFRSPIPDYSLWEEDEEVMEHFLYLKTAAPQAMNAIRNKMPPYPPQIYPEMAEELYSGCDMSSCTDVCVCPHLLKLPLGRVVQLALFSGYMDKILSDSSKGSAVMAHPIHIHGGTMRLVKTGWLEVDSHGNPLDINATDLECEGEGKLRCHHSRWRNSSWDGGRLPGMVGPYAVNKDTVIVPALGYVVLRFRADNPGFWLLHCHVELHMSGGMSLVVQVGEIEDMPKSLPGMQRCGDFL